MHDTNETENRIDHRKNGKKRKTMNVYISFIAIQGGVSLVCLCERVCVFCSSSLSMRRYLHRLYGYANQMVSFQFSKPRVYSIKAPANHFTAIFQCGSSFTALAVVLFFFSFRYFFFSSNERVIFQWETCELYALCSR